MDAQGGGDISYRLQILTDFSEIGTEGQNHHKEVMKKVIFELAPKRRLRLGMDALRGGGFI